MAGTWCDRPVIVTGSSYAFPAPADIEREMKELEAWAVAERNHLHPVEFAALLHLKADATSLCAWIDVFVKWQKKAAPFWSGGKSAAQQREDEILTMPVAEICGGILIVIAPL